MTDDKAHWAQRVHDKAMELCLAHRTNLQHIMWKRDQACLDCIDKAQRLHAVLPDRKSQ